MAKDSSGRTPYCRLQDEVGLRLDALTALFARMWAAVHVGDRDTLLSKPRHDVGVDAVHVLESQQPLGDAALVGDDEEEEAFLKGSEGVEGLGEEDHFGRVS